MLPEETPGNVAGRSTGFDPTRRFRRLWFGDEAQMLPAMSVMILAIFSICGLSIDLGHVYSCYLQLQASTNAAALAGAQSLPSSSAASAANSYSSVAGAKNHYSDLMSTTMVSGYPMLKCLTTLQNQGVPCLSPTNANAVVVEQTAQVHMFFAGIMGHSTLTIGSVATAAMRGGVTSPVNVAIIVDTTGSMMSYDSDSSCASTRLSCALNGVQQILTTVEPCGITLSSCGTVTNGSVANPVGQVSLFTFPNLVSSASAANDYNCSGTAPVASNYTFPAAGASSYSPSGDTYRVLPFNSDYRTSDTTTSLNQNSNLVVAAGAKSGCTGLQAPGGISTYYAGVIYAAQSALTAASSSQIQNVMIILSDGDSNETAAQMPGASTTSGTYPSTINQCQQAVTAAHAAAVAGTRVYSVAYGSAATGCATDSPSTTPCQTMQAMASAPQYFFSDYTATGGDSSCISAAHPTTSLSQIFSQIANDLTTARLIPNGTT